MAETFHVRIRPYDKGKGYLLRRYVDGTSRMLFREDNGWYRNVPASVAERLKAVHSRVGDPSSPLAFDVLPEAEAIAFAKAEAEAIDRAGRSTPLGAREPERTGPTRQDAPGPRAMTSRDIARAQARAVAQPVEEAPSEPASVPASSEPPAPRVGQVTKPKMRRTR